MLKPVAITAIASISPLGIAPDEVWNSYLLPGHCMREKDLGSSRAFAAPLSAKGLATVASLREQYPEYRHVDDSVCYAVLASRNAIRQAGWQKGDRFGVNIGSSRGATSLFEKYHKDFLEHNSTATLTSPLTTLGNISSRVAQDLQNKGPEISHSVTCSTALHALLNGVAWLQSGLADRFLVGGSEAPLTPFTIAQMRALRLYAKSSPVLSFQGAAADGTAEDTAYPCRALDLQKSQNTMVLGEGAAMACLEKGTPSHALGYISGIGYATEVPTHSVSISAGASCLQESMRMAIGNMAPDEVDVVVMHAPGTVKGDRAEYHAVKAVFGNRLPALTTNKWKTGHTFGASGMLSVEMALLMLQYRQFLPAQNFPSKIEKILVNAVGFGGNAVSVVVER